MSALVSNTHQMCTGADTQLSFCFTNVELFAWAFQNIENPCCTAIHKFFNVINLLPVRIGLVNTLTDMEVHIRTYCLNGVNQSTTS